MMIYTYTLFEITYVIIDATKICGEYTSIRRKKWLFQPSYQIRETKVGLQAKKTATWQ
jgi:hypothetical protein